MKVGGVAAEVLEQLLRDLEEIMDTPAHDEAPHPMLAMIREDVDDARATWERAKLSGAAEGRRGT